MAPHRSCLWGGALGQSELRHNGVLRSSHIRPSAKSINFNACNYLIMPDDIRSPSGIPGLSGWGYAGVLRPYIVGLLVCLPAKRPREEGEDSLWATHEEEDHDEPKRAMGRRSRTDPSGRRRGSPTNYCWSRIC